MTAPDVPHDCQADPDEEAEWCHQCGAELSDFGTCSNDHDEIDEFPNAYCDFCGERLAPYRDADPSEDL